jgi:hypothetical protein
MTHEEAIKWLLARGGSVTTKTLLDGGNAVVVSANGLASSVHVKNLSDQVEVRRCELEAIEDLKQLLRRSPPALGTGRRSALAGRPWKANSRFANI